MSRVFSVFRNDYLSAKSIGFILTLLTRRKKRYLLLFKQFFFWYLSKKIAIGMTQEKCPDSTYALQSPLLPRDYTENM